MKYWVLLWSALWRKPFRTVLALLSVVVAFTLFGLLHGVATAIDGIIDTMAANRLSVQSLNGRGVVLPISYANQISRIPGVAAVTAVVWVQGYYQEPRNTFFVRASSDSRPVFESKDVDISRAEIDAFERTRTGAVAHRTLANRFGWKVGDRIPFRSTVAKQDRSTLWEFDLVGIYDSQDLGLENQLWFHYDYLDQGRAFNKGTAQSYQILTSDPQHNAAIADAIDQRFANSSAPTATQSDREWAEAGMEQAIDFNLLVQVIVGSSLFTLLLVTGNTLMESVRQRIPELAVLKTVGYPDRTLLALVIGESSLLYLMGAGIGLALSMAFFPLIAPGTTSGRVGMPLPVILQGGAIALCIAMLSSIAPALFAHRLSVIDALRRH